MKKSLSSLNLSMTHRHYIITIDDINKISFLNSQYNFNKNSNHNNIIIIEDYTYDDFDKIYEISINNKLDLYDEKYDFFGIDKYLVYQINKYNRKISDCFSNYYNFQKNGGFVSAKNNKEYKLFTEIFKNDTNIIPIQYLTIDNTIFFVFIKEFIPVYNYFIKNYFMYNDTKILKHDYELYIDLSEEKSKEENSPIKTPSALIKVDDCKKVFDATNNDIKNNICGECINKNCTCEENINKNTNKEIENEKSDDEKSEYDEESSHNEKSSDDVDYFSK